MGRRKKETRQAGWLQGPDGLSQGKSYVFSYEKFSILYFFLTVKKIFLESLLRSVLSDRYPVNDISSVLKLYAWLTT